MVFLDPKSDKESELTEAFGILEQGNWSKKELESYDRYIDAIRCEMSRIDTAEARGESRGEIRAKLEVAKNLLDILDVETIAKKTGLSIEQVKKIKKI